jgi:hypothetical protein
MSSSPVLYPALEPTTAAKIMSEYPNGASLSPAGDSIPPTPKDYSEMEKTLDYLCDKQDEYPRVKKDYWKIEEKKVNVKAIMLGDEYRRVCGDKKRGKLRREMKLKDVMKRLEKNRKNWARSVQALRGFEIGSWQMKERECRRAYILGGLVHVRLLEQRLEGVADMLRKDGEGELQWKWKPMEQGERDRYFGDEDEFIDSGDEEILEQEWTDDCESPEGRVASKLPKELSKNHWSEHVKHQKEIEDAESAEYCAYGISGRKREATEALEPDEIKADEF